MHIINSLAPNTASGWDGIGPQLVRDNCQLFLEPLEYLFNSFLFKGIKLLVSLISYWRKFYIKDCTHFLMENIFYIKINLALGRIIPFPWQFLRL